MTDEQLLREMRKGNQEALQQMIQRYHRYLTTIIGNILGSGGSREDIEELVQDTFYAVWNRAGEIRGPLKPYLCTAARNRGDYGPSGQCSGAV
ncbi:MAG: sigma factor [Oscillospiraceae bacterium]|nr:sigma factor [Oscillospiraceae bacterium]